MDRGIEGPLLFVALLLGLLQAAGAAEPVDFQRDVRPLLRERCVRCHGAEKQRGGLRLDARSFAFKGGDSGPVLVPGDIQSELVRRVTSDDDGERMPPEGARLTTDEVALLTGWIADGANWPETDYDRQATLDRRLEHWSFQPLADVALPELPDDLTSAARSAAIDHFIIARLRSEGLALAPPAERGTLIRRLSLDLLGLPPSPEEVEAFERSTDPAAYEKLVESMLASPRYGERWAQHWLDVVRYADTHGFEVNTPREHAWPYRDYVIRSLNEDKPYDQFVIEQLAGDALQVDEATGFLVTSAVLLPGQIGADEPSKRAARQDALDEIIVGTSGALLGLTLGCARCHDHKFDPLTQRDYYAMQAFFAGVEYGDRAIEDEQHQQNLARAAELAPRIARLETQLARFEPEVFPGRIAMIDELDESRVFALKTANGPGTIIAGNGRGMKDDAGARDRVNNLSQGQYTWWDNVPGEDVLAYQPGLSGRFRLWISWGVHGSGAHTRDARYLLDPDGDLHRRDDQQELATVDQYYPAGIREGETPQTPLWSGLLDVGEVEVAESSKIVLRGGETGSAITADVIVLQEILPTAPGPAQLETSALPWLRGPVSPVKNVEPFAPVPAKFVRFVIEATVDDNRHEPCLDELEIYGEEDPGQNLALASKGATASSSGNYADIGPHQLNHIHDGHYGNQRSWISNQLGGGWVQIELAETNTISRVVWGRDRQREYTDRLPVRYRIDVSLDGQNWRTVANSADRVPLGTPHDPVLALLRNRPADQAAELMRLTEELDQLRTQQSQLAAPRLVFGGTFREPDTTYVLRRGDAEQRVEQIGPSYPALFGQPEFEADMPEQQRRLALARWIASADHPLTARVMVNRIWLYHFGRGLVDTPNDFGLNGALPSHPELLDWLAAEFIRSGWSMKHMHRLIVHSATYRQISQQDSLAVQQDPDNRLLWHFPSRRLEAESIRDSMLSVSGELNLRAGGPGFDFFKTRGGLDGFPPVEEFGPEQLRRMVYAHKVRMETVPVFGAFDCPDAGQSVPRRSQSTTAIQALNLFNSRFVVDRAERFARRVREASSGEAEQIARAFQLAVGRRPTETEQAASLPVVRAHGLAALCRALLNSNEFVRIP